MGYNGVKDAGVEALAETVRCNSTLTSLGIPSNGISDTGVQVSPARPSRPCHAHPSYLPHSFEHSVTLAADRRTRLTPVVKPKMRDVRDKRDMTRDTCARNMSEVT